jgi:hypothetical protein
MKRAIKTFLKLLVLPLTTVFFLSVFILTWAYEPSPTHTALAQKSAQLYGQFYSGDLTQEQISWIQEGARNEDTPPRWINHFYDPTTDQGWTSEQMGNLPANVVALVSGIVLSPEKAVSAPDWAQNQELQTRYTDYDGNRTFQKAVFDYVDGNKNEAFKSLGHILHLIEDMTVPAHTRQDTHWDALGDPGEPYEKWAKENTDLSHLANLNPINENFHCDNISDCFFKVAKYSNENFFSEDTINSNKYKSPKINRIIDNGDFAFGYNNEKILYKIIFRAGTKTVEKITVNDPFIHSSYWYFLSKQAVLGGVEIIRLFFGEVAKAQNDKSRLETPPAEPIGYFYNLNTGLAALYSQAAGAIFSPYGELIKLKNYFNQIENFATGISNQMVSGFLSLFSTVSGPIAEEGSAPSPAQTGEAPGQIVPSASLSPTPTKVVIAQPAKVTLPPNTVVAIEKTEAEGNIVEEISPQDAEIPSPIIEEKNPSQAVLPSPSPTPALSPSPTPASFIPGVAGSPPSTVSSANTTSPETSFFSQPPNFSTSTTAVFIFSSSESNSTFECQLDGATSTVCISPKEYSGLAEGSHTFQVKAADAAGNQDQTPAQYAWVIDLTAPQISNIASAAGRTSALISWTASEAGVFQIRYGTTTSYSLTSATTSAASLTIGSLSVSTAYHFRLSAQDNAGNATSSADNIFTTTAQAENVVISEIQITGGSASTTDEFVELYNPTASAIDLTGWKLARRTANATSSYHNLLSSFPSKIIPAHGYFLVVHPTGYDGGVPADAVYSSTGYSIAPNNAVILYSDAGHTIVDMVGFGSASSSETATIGNLTAHQSVERKATATSTAGLLVNGSHQWQGNAYDSDDNSNDFVLQSNPNPQNSLMLTEPRNSLPNLMTTAAWPTWQKNLARTGLSSANSLATSTLTVKWTATTTAVTDSFVSRPVLDDQGNIYIGRTAGLAKYSSAGNLLWLYATSTASSAPLITSDGTIFFRCAWALCAIGQDGQFKWKYDLSGSAGANATLAILSDGTLITQSDEKVYAINQDATLKWIFDSGQPMGSSNSITAPVIDSADSIYIAIDNYLYAISSSGSLIWAWPVPNSGHCSSLTLNGDNLYFSTEEVWPNGGLYALNKAGGSIYWLKTSDPLGYNSHAELAPAIDSSGQVYAIMFYFNGIAKLEAYSTSNVPLWIYESMSMNGSRLAAPVLTADGKIYLAYQSELRIFDAVSGNLLPSSFIPPDDNNFYIHFGAVGSDGTIYTASDNILYAVGN